eukprot:m.707616 g.707616  ORF g.707616 m.707616 type:complete len:89 (-) comp58732_c0_seq8:404-670(-)
MLAGVLGSSGELGQVEDKCKRLHRRQTAPLRTVQTPSATAVASVNDCGPLDAVCLVAHESLNNSYLCEAGACVCGGVCVVSHRRNPHP